MLTKRAHYLWRRSHFLPTSVSSCHFSGMTIAQKSSKCPSAWYFLLCYLAGENTSGRHERKKTMTGSHFRLRNTGISSEQLSMWQSCLLQRSARTWWIPAGSTSVCKSLSLKILIISLESKSLIMTSQWIAAIKPPRWHHNTIRSDVQHQDAFSED